jgi:hypothetical protein
MRTRGKRGPKPLFPPGVRVCTDCGGTKPVAEFVPIKSTKAGYCGACRSCRTRRNWENYHPGRSYIEWLEHKATASDVPAKPKVKLTTRTCSDCKQTKALTEFVPIRACKAGWYGRCHVCRARRARERYKADPAERENQKARSARNAARRKLAAAISA